MPRPFATSTSDAMPCKAVIYDMDGLMIDSEPLWHVAEKQAFSAIGVQMETSDCDATTGLRIDEVVEHHYAHHRQGGWDEAPAADGAPRTRAAVTAAIVDCMEKLLRERGGEIAKPGLAQVTTTLLLLVLLVLLLVLLMLLVLTLSLSLLSLSPSSSVSQSMAFFVAKGLPLGLASSSPRRLIDAGLAGLGLDQGQFKVVVSAEKEVTMMLLVLLLLLLLLMVLLLRVLLLVLTLPFARADATFWLSEGVRQTASGGVSQRGKSAGRGTLPLPGTRGLSERHSGGEIGADEVHLGRSTIPPPPLNTS